jgi:hypothetical protein
MLREKRPGLLAGHTQERAQIKKNNWIKLPLPHVLHCTKHFRSTPYKLLDLFWELTFSELQPRHRLYWPKFVVVFLSHSSIIVEQYINFATGVSFPAFHLPVFPPFNTIPVTCFLLIFWDTDSVIKVHINKLINIDLHITKVLNYNLVVYGSVTLLTAISWTPCNSSFLTERFRIQIKKMDLTKKKNIGIYLPGAGFHNSNTVIFLVTLIWKSNIS